MRVVILGGGVAGVCCAEELAEALTADDSILVVSASEAVKGVTAVTRLTNILEDFDVEQRPLAALAERREAGPSTSVLRGEAEAVDYVARRVRVRIIAVDSSEAGPARGGGICEGAAGAAGDRIWLAYDRLCICTGSRPRLFYGTSAQTAPEGDTVEVTPWTRDYVIGIRDTESVSDLCDRLRRARGRRTGSGGSGAANGRVLLLGNGGIALEFVDAVRGMGLCDELVWAVKDKYIGNTFFDASVSRFFFESGTVSPAESPATGIEPAGRSREPSTGEGPPAAGEAPVESRGRSVVGAALGPNWLATLQRTWARASCGKDSEGGGGGDDDSDSTPNTAGSQAAAAWSGRLNLELNSTLVTIQRNDTTAAEEAGADAFPPCYPITATLSNGKEYGCDVVVSATGVCPNVEPFLLSCPWPGSDDGERPGPPSTGSPRSKVDDEEEEAEQGEKGARSASTSPLAVETAQDGFGGIVVDPYMRVVMQPPSRADPDETLTVAATPPTPPKAAAAATVVPGVFAAGDVCRLACLEGESEHWFQMRLWSQARTQGLYAAHCIAGDLDELQCGFNFDLFAHVTKCFGWKVILLGRYNGQGLGTLLEDAIRERVVTVDGVVGRACSTGDDDGGRKEAESGPSMDGKHSAVAPAPALAPTPAPAPAPAPARKAGLYADDHHAIRGGDSGSDVLPAAGTLRPGAPREATEAVGCGEAVPRPPAGPRLPRPKRPGGTHLSSPGGTTRMVAAAGGPGCGRRDSDTEDVQMLVRVTPGVEYIKVVVQRGRIQGALLVGDTDLEETFENLILSRLDVTRHLGGLLDPTIDIEDYFD